MNTKYELLDNDTIQTPNGVTLKRIRALVAIGSLVVAGELGGYVESEYNLAIDGDAWVCGDAWVYGNARVCGDAWVYGNARVCGDAWVCGNARVCGDAWVCGNARVYGDAMIEQIADIFWISIIGSENGTYTAFKSKDGLINVSRGCFNGSLDSFEQAVKETHGDNEYAQQYKLIIELTKLKLGVK